jgi:hypothetical protein
MSGELGHIVISTKGIILLLRNDMAARWLHSFSLSFEMTGKEIIEYCFCCIHGVVNINKVFSAHSVSLRLKFLSDNKRMI